MRGIVYAQTIPVDNKWRMEGTMQLNRTALGLECEHKGADRFRVILSIDGFVLVEFVTVQGLVVHTAMVELFEVKQ